MRIVALGTCLLLVGLPALLTAQEKPSAEGLEFFESKIRPMLAKNCYMCHSRSAKAAMGGLVVDTRDAIRRGGQSGPAIVPGKVEESFLLKAVRQEGKIKMPPTGKLSAEILTDLVKWVEMGAPDPRDEKAAPPVSQIDIKKGREFWAFQAPKKLDAPAVKGSAWTRGNIDRFILARLEEKNLKPVHDADRTALLRRATFDLTGLPPTPGEIDDFVKDKSRNAFPKAVDRLLGSERFGERWGRHWLDVARYAESMGRTRNYPFPVAWRYRDYVIQSFNQDKPYDQFIREQVAGDLLPAGTPEEKREKLIATGFLAMGAHDLNEADRAQSRMDIVDEQVTAVSRAFVGLTVNCARCHDHKFDPIPTKDYYALAGIFGSTEMMDGLRVRPPFNTGYYSDAQLVKLDGLPEYTSGNVEELTQKRAELMDRIAHLKKDRFEARQLAKEFGDLPIPENLAMGVKDAKKPVNFQVNVRGDAHTLGDVAPRNFVQVLYEPGADLPEIPETGSGRLQLAEWLTRRDNPLTARVMANRVWHQLFGRGMVATVDNFGKMGNRPTHPELLDYLAVQFMDQGWSVKKLIREVMLSHTYQLSIDHDENNFQIEPDNNLLWRANRRRLEVEALRDSMLLVSGQLDLQRPEASPVYRFPLGNEVNRGGGKAEPWEVSARYRSVYVPVLRNAMPRFFESFDFPESSEGRGRRDITTVAPQSLFLMNSPFVLEQARTASERLLSSVKTDEARVTRLYREVLSRNPTSAETKRALEYIRGLMSAAEAAEGDASEGKKEQDAWTAMYHALFASAEFRYRM